MSRLAKKRVDARLTQEQLATMARMSLPTLRAYEWKTRDINKCSVATALRLADALGCDVRDILEPEEEK